MIVKWKVNSYSYGDTSIKRVECTRETDSSVWVMENASPWGSQPGKMVERRHAKGDDYHATWEDAHAYLLEKAERQLEATRASLARVQGHYGNVKGLKKPADAT